MAGIRPLEIEFQINASIDVGHRVTQSQKDSLHDRQIAADQYGVHHGGELFIDYLVLVYKQSINQSSSIDPSNSPQVKSENSTVLNLLDAV